MLHIKRFQIMTSNIFTVYRHLRFNKQNHHIIFVSKKMDMMYVNKNTQINACLICEVSKTNKLGSAIKKRL